MGYARRFASPSFARLIALQAAWVESCQRTRGAGLHLLSFNPARFLAITHGVTFDLTVDLEYL